MALRHAEFEWDPVKAAVNSDWHGVEFPRAAEALSDPLGELLHLDVPQIIRGEKRWLTFCTHPADRVVILAVVWTSRRRENRLVTRIISARHATPKESKFYEEKVLPKR